MFLKSWGRGVVSSQKIQFGQFVLDLSRYELTNGGKLVRLERIPMDLLIFLVKESGRLVEREEITERLWGKCVYFDADNSLNTAIRKIRRALGDKPEDPQYLETVQGKGYRFKGQVRGLSAVVPRPAETERQRIMLAVLPFENLSGDPSREYFSDGLTEETIMRLGQLSPRRMGVIARTSSMAYKGTDKTVARIGEELGVDYVLEGSVRQDNECVRITAQLIRVQDQVHLWAESFDRLLSRILDIHREIGAAIAAQVKLELMDPERQRSSNASRNPEARDLHLHGRYHYARSNRLDLEKAVEYFRSATERDPEYTLAFTGLADSLMILPITGDVASQAVFPEAKLAVTRALELDPDSAEARTSAATAKFWFDWDFKGAEASARRAIQLNENYPLAHLYLAHVLSNVGRHEEGLAVIRQALVLDPYSLITGAMLGQFLYQAGKNAEAIQQFKIVLGMEPRFWVGQICAAKAYEKAGMYCEALTACDRAWEFSGGNTEALSIAGYVHAVTGNFSAAEEKIRQMRDLKCAGYVPPYNLALVYAGLKQTEVALDHLQQAFSDRDVHMPFLLDHKWDGIRRYPEFEDLLLRVGLSMEEASARG